MNLRLLTPLGATILLLLLATGAGAESGEVEGRVTVNPLHVSLHVVPGESKAGEVAIATGRVENHGNLQLTGVELTLRLQAASLLSRPLGRQFSGSLPPGGSISQRWAVCASAPGQYLIMVIARARAADGSEIIAESEARLLTVTPGQSRCAKQ